MSQHHDLRERALQSAQAGLDFLVRHQITDYASADQGRLPFSYDCAHHRVVTLTTNWTTGIAIDALLAGFNAFGTSAYREAAGRAAAYLRSLQAFNPNEPRLVGVFHETTPQSNMAHPRDALTAALALLDWAMLADDAQAMMRVVAYADWFVTIGMEKGYPYWTVRFDGQPWEPMWCGSFHSGSAFFLCRLFQVTGDQKYLNAVQRILTFYNAHHLSDDGRISVILDRDGLQCLDGKADGRFSNPGWEMMHVYNDDFGALANLAMWQLTGDGGLSSAAERFLRRMLVEQQADGGFGPTGQSIPSAGGVILVELMAAQQLGHAWADDASLDRAAEYLMSVQIRRENDPADGAFLGFTEQYTLQPEAANIRAGAYAIMALLRYAGVRDTYYFV